MKDNSVSARLMPGSYIREMINTGIYCLLDNFAIIYDADKRIYLGSISNSICVPFNSNCGV